MGGPSYPWLEHVAQSSLAEAIPAPAGYVRVGVEAGSFAEWLRGLPLLPGRPPVHLYDGRLKSNQEAHAAVLDLDVGRQDLQQCADAVMRLRAEYLYSRGQLDRIAFRWTNGDTVGFAKWAKGWRPSVAGSRVSWSRSRPPDSSHASLRGYLTEVFRYAGTASLSQELVPVASVQDMRAGDVFIQGGFPGHAILVLDLAENGSSKKFLLAQGYMPAQEMHLLRMPGSEDPWYDEGFGDTLVTPEWIFAASDLKRFP